MQACPSFTSLQKAHNENRLEPNPRQCGPRAGFPTICGSLIALALLSAIRIWVRPIMVKHIGWNDYIEAKVRGRARIAYCRARLINCAGDPTIATIDAGRLRVPAPQADNGRAFFRCPMASLYTDHRFSAVARPVSTIRDDIVSRASLEGEQYWVV